MKNYLQDGDKPLTLIAPYTVASGAAAKVGNIFGVAVADVASGASGAFQPTGVFDLACVTTDTFTAGALVYWDDSAKNCTSTSSGNSKIGAATVAKINGPATVTVRLNGTSLT